MWRIGKGLTPLFPDIVIPGLTWDRWLLKIKPSMVGHRSRIKSGMTPLPPTLRSG
jgi:hypothetical protein